VNSFLRDFSFAARTLRKNPTFTVTALVTLALGIGASAAIFSVVDAVLLRPLPYREAQRLIFLTSDLRTRNVKDFPVAPGDLKDLRDQGTQFEGIAGVNTFRFSLVGENGEPEQVRGAAATTNLFHVLGIRTILHAAAATAATGSSLRTAAGGRSGRARRGGGTGSDRGASAATPSAHRHPGVRLLAAPLWR
jgi:hypothetical protein